MNAWSVQSCRACLVDGLVSDMYDLGVPDTLELYTRSANLGISLEGASDIPQFICSMCYRLCELIQGFRDRCRETEKKLKQVRTKKRPSATVKPKGPSSAAASSRVKRETVHTGEEEGDDDDDCLPEMIEMTEDDQPDIETFVPEDTNWPDVEDYTLDSETEAEPPKMPKLLRKKKSKKGPRLDPRPAVLEWVPGKTKNAVWRYFERDTTKNYTRCMVEGCGTIITTRYSETSSLRHHLRRRHNIVLPTVDQQKDVESMNETMATVD